MPINTSFFSAYPGYFGSDQTVFNPNSALKYSLTAGGQNKLGTNGGAILGVSTKQLQSTRLFDTDFNFPFLGQRDVYNENKPVIASTVNGVTKAISGGTFGVMVAGKYIVMALNSGQVAGITTGALANIMTIPGGHYNAVGQNLSNQYRNTWLIRITGGWYYQTGMPVNAQYSRDHFGTDNEGSAVNPGRIVFNAVGNNATITKQNYQTRNG